MGWWDETYRKLFFDLHSSQYAAGLASDFDAERWAERIEATGAQAVSVFMHCAYGWSFHRKGSYRHVHPHLPEGLDMAEEQIRALHKRGIKAIGYIAVLPSEALAETHPDWLVHRMPGIVGGRDGSRSVCVLGPATEEWFLPFVAETVSEYDLDAVFFDGIYDRPRPCYCPSCQAQFAAFTGGAELPLDPSSDSWLDYVRWTTGEFRRLRVRVCETVRAERPELPVSINFVSTPNKPEAVDPEVTSLMADVHPPDVPFECSYVGHYWALSGKPWDIMNTAFGGFWGDWDARPALSMQQELGSILANGGLAWPGYQVNHRFEIEQAVLDELGKALRFVEEREPWLRGSEPVADVLVLDGAASRYANERPGVNIDDAGVRGAHRALTESCIPYHMVDEVAMDNWLDQASVVIIPDQRHLTPDLWDRLERWVSDGGLLVATALSGQADALGKTTDDWPLGELAGVAMTGLYPHSHAYLRVREPALEPGTLDMAHLCECVWAMVEPTADDVQVLVDLDGIYLRSDGKYLLRWSPVGEPTGHPAMTARAVGEGWVVYCAGALFRAYQAKNQWNIKHLVANVIKMLLPEAPVEIDAPVWIEATVRRQLDEKRLLVHLVNPHATRSIDGTSVISEQIPPVHDITVRVRCEEAVQGVTLEPCGSALEFEQKDGTVTIAVPRLDVHQIVVIQH